MTLIQDTIKDYNQGLQLWITITGNIYGLQLQVTITDYNNGLQLWITIADG